MGNVSKNESNSMCSLSHDGLKDLVLDGEEIGDGKKEGSLRKA